MRKGETPMRIILPCECETILSMPEITAFPAFTSAVCPSCKVEYSVLREEVLRGDAPVQKATIYVASLARLQDAVLNGLRISVDAPQAVAVS
jgi:hypothetical protein